MSEVREQPGLDKALRERIQTAYRQWLAARGFSARKGQRLMIAEIARTFAEIEADDDGVRVEGAPTPHVCVVEAGTGTGKTVAYGLAAIPVAKARGLRLVIATATVALQEQLVSRDLPDLATQSGLEFGFALAKGRGRYACPARLDRHLNGDLTEALPADLFGAEAPSGALARALYRDMADALVTGGWDGDRETFERAVDDVTWSGATIDHRACTGNQCSFFRGCPYFRARERVDQADVVVANHDLVLADLALGGGVVLPDPAGTLYVFDEAHHLANKALGHLRRTTRVLGGIRELEQVERLLGTLAQRAGRDAVLVDAAQRMAVVAEPLRVQLRQALDLVETLPGLQQPTRSGGARHRFELGDVGADLREIAAGLATGHGEVLAVLETAAQRLRALLERADADRDELQSWQEGLGLHEGRIEAALALWQDYALPMATAGSDALVHARWVRRPDGEDGLDLEICASPLHAAAELQRVLWSRCFGATLTSATLTSTDGFRRFTDAVGVPEDSRLVLAPSSFPFAKAAELTVPAMNVDPADAEAHAEAVADHLARSVDPAEGTLVIFTSWRHLDLVSRALPPALLARALSQADLAKGEILRRQRARIDAGEGSLIFGLASFAEGIDLPGDYCRHVIITKLPFAVPDDPVEAATAEWLEARGRNPFMEMSVPDAALRLKQACGRLLRSEADSGRITLLDPRIVSRRYGRAILDVLPPFRRNLQDGSASGE